MIITAPEMDYPDKLDMARRRTISKRSSVKKTVNTIGAYTNLMLNKKKKEEGKAKRKRTRRRRNKSVVTVL